MATNILGVGQSALAAAQAGLVTTGHNIANASTPGYNRQVVVQESAGSQDTGFGFVGKGTQVSEVKRIYNEFLSNQVNASYTSQNEVQTYYTQISRINNQFADQDSGLSPVIQDFFKGLQDLANIPGGTSSAAARQGVLSTAETLTARFQSLNGQLQQMREDVGGQINASIDTINNYADQIAKLNDVIEKAQGNAGGRPSNDLLDQRDLAISELSKEIKTTVVKQGANYSVFIGNGQPLVVGARTFDLVPTVSRNDPSRAEVGYVSNGQTVELAESSLTGGKLGGLMNFRTKTLDTAQNSLGRIATGMALAFNAQHQLGQDQNGAIGGKFFNYAQPDVRASASNTSGAVVSASLNPSSASALTTSDYLLETVTAAVAGPPATPGAYKLTRLTDGTVTNFATFPQTVDGVNINIASGNPAAGESFVIKPTVNGAAGFSVAISDVGKIAAGSPILTTAPTANKGSGAISAGTVNGPAPVNANLQQPVTITFTAAGTFDVSGTGTGNPTGVAYTPGGNITYNGWTVQITGTPAVGDTFTIGPNTNGQGDNRNAVLLAAQQTGNTLANNTTSYQGAYAQLVSQVGNKTHELEVTGKAEGKMLSQAIAAQQAESGVNLDEEATNLLRYQQAYQAAGKVMQTASKLFDLLLELGN
jgi:flagellar hook-associated protein 1 FlgK